MLFTFDFPRDRLAGAERVRTNAELVTRDDDQSHRVRNEREISVTYAADGWQIFFGSGSCLTRVDAFGDCIFPIALLYISYPKGL